MAAGETAGIERLGLSLRLRLRVRPPATLFSGRLAHALGSVLRSPVAVERLELEPSTGEVLYHPKPAHERGKPCAESFDPAKFLARAPRPTRDERRPRSRRLVELTG